MGVIYFLCVGGHPAALKEYLGGEKGDGGVLWGLGGSMEGGEGLSERGMTDGRGKGKEGHGHGEFGQSLRFLSQPEGRGRAPVLFYPRSPVFF